MARLLAFVIALVIFATTSNIWIAGVVGAVAWIVLEVILAALVSGSGGQSKGA